MTFNYKTIMIMKPKLLTVLVFLACLYGHLSVYAQTQSISNSFQAMESNPYLMPPTPDAAAFLNYGQYSVSQASGKVDVTIPIYEIRTRELDFPITLSYIGGGIKVTDQASWAGLGWVLNAGGVVNHTVLGLPDKNWFPELPTADKMRNNNDYYSLNKTVAAENGGLDGTDKMRDRYDYSYGKGGGTFYITSYETYLQTPYTENRIKRLMNAAQTLTKGFVITDDKGVSYYFERPETSTVLSTSYNHTNYKTQPLAEEYTYNSAWYLSKIVSMNRKDSINFVYSTDSESYTDYKLSHTYSVRTDTRVIPVDREIFSVVNTRKVNSTPVLQKIVFQQGYIVFESSSDRRDNRSYRITGIKIYNSNNDLIKSIEFSHSYFGGNRLKLDSVTFKGRDGEIYDSVDFDYYNPQTVINSWISSNNYGHLNVGEANSYYAQDYMGYYNGAVGNKSLIGYFPRDDYNYAKFAADRNHSASSAKVHSLKSLSYLSGAHVEFIYDTENYVKPRNPAIKVKEIISTDHVGGSVLKKIYSYSGCKGSMPLQYESQLFEDYFISVAPEIARTYVIRTYSSDPLIYGYEPGWKALYKRIEERTIDSANPADTMLVVRTYDVTSADFVDTGYYLELYGRTADDYNYRQQELALTVLGEWPVIQGLPDGITPSKYNVPGYVVSNEWEEGLLLKEEVYKKSHDVYKLSRSTENKYSVYQGNSRIPVGLYSKGTLFSCMYAGRPANWYYISVPSVNNFYFFDICVSTGWKKLTSTTTIEYENDRPHTTLESYTYGAINKAANPHSYCTLYSKNCRESDLEWRDVSFYKYISESDKLEQKVKDSILSRNYKSALIEEQYTRLRGTSGPTFVRNNIYTLSNDNICLKKIEQYYSGNDNADWKQEVSVQQFDKYGRPVWTVNEKGVSVLRLWRTDAIYPSAIIYNAPFPAVMKMLGDQSFNSIRVNMPCAEVHTYAYEDLIGLKSETGPDGTITTYDYDGFGRLKSVNRLSHGTYFPVERYEYSYGATKGADYIKTTRLTDSGTSSVQYDYYNAFGAKIQTNLKNAGADGNDIVTDYVVNGRGQVLKETLPAPVMSAAGYAEGVLSLAQSYYEDTFPVRRYEYEDVYAGRILAEHTPGQNWQNGKYKKYRYAYNDTTRLYECKNWRLSGNDRSNDSFSLVSTYPDGYISIFESEDEDGIRVLNFVNPAGQKVLERRDAEEGYADTYYIYDQYGNLRIVLPPMASSLLPAATASTKQAILDKYAYIYGYDNLDRCIRRKLPGREWEYMGYDKAGYCVFAQDGELRKSGKWKFQIHDRLGRLAMSGICKNTDAQNLYSRYIYAEFSLSDGDSETGYVVSGVQLVEPEYHTIKYYDDYSYLSLASLGDCADSLSSGTSPGHEPVWTNIVYNKDISVRGQQTGERTFRLDGDGETIVATYYNQLNQPVQTVAYDTAAGSCDHIYTNFFRGGAPARTTRNHIRGGVSYDEEKCYSYDAMGRVKSLSHRANKGQTVALFRNRYDATGRLAEVILQDGRDTVSYSYNVRNKLTSISSSDFSQNLYYDSGAGVPRYNDFVSHVAWRIGDYPVQGYLFEYDKSGRLKSGTYGEGTALAQNRNRYSESILSYDLNGNILQYRRWGITGESSFGMVDDVSHQYEGNLLFRSSDAVDNEARLSGVYNRFFDTDAAEKEYVYDGNGNLLIDANRGMSAVYNCLSLPETVSIAGKGTVSFGYDALGNKKSAEYRNGGDTTVVDYLHDIAYKNGSPEYVITETGYLSLTDGVYRYYIKDYLGSIRLVKNSSGAIEEINNYYPSGALFAAPVPDVQNYKYSGKEIVSFAGLGWYDYGARYYDPVLMRWHSADPLLEKYYGVSPYAFCSNNYSNFVDPDGRAWETAWDLLNLGTGIKSFVDNVKAGNVGAAILDGAGIVADAVAVITPFIPGGAGAVISAARNGGKVSDILNLADDVGDASKSADVLKTFRQGPKATIGTRPHGNPDHNGAIDDIITWLKSDDANVDIRKNQVQVDVNGNVRGKNRPDVQWNNNDVHYNLEVDRSPKNSNRHKSVIEHNDSRAVFKKALLEKDGKYKTDLF